MSRLMKRQRQLHPVLAESGGFSSELRHFGRLQPHSCLHPLQKPASDHPNIGERKQGDELRSVFLKPTVAHFGVTELTLDDSERMFHLGPHTGLEFLGLFHDHTPRGVLLLLSFARSHSNMPIHACGFRALGGTLITGISKHNGLFAVQQAVSLGHIVDVGCGADDGVHQAGIGIDPDMRFHSKVPLVALLDLVHLGVTLTGTVLGGTGCCNQGGVHHSAALEQQAVGGQFGVDDLKDLRTQVVLFEQVSETQNADPVRDALGTADAHEGTVEAGLEQGFFGSQVRQAKPLLQAMNAQHHCKIKRRASRLGHRGVRRDQRQQFAPRHDLLHFIEQDLLARAPVAQIKAKVFLLHAVIDRNLHASVKPIGAEF
jgi:hypothetical protein